MADDFCKINGKFIRVRDQTPKQDSRKRKYYRGLRL